MAHTSVIRFGPGRFERVVLRFWPAKRFGGPRRLKGRFLGYVPVYCGCGWDHMVPVRGVFDEFASPDQDGRFALADAACRGDQNAAYQLVADLVEDVLDGWEDPCETARDSLIS